MEEKILIIINEIRKAKKLSELSVSSKRGK